VSPLAIDIGGTHTRIAAAGGQVARFATEPDYRAQLAAVSRAIRSAGIAPSAAGVSFTGRLDPAGRSVAVSLNLPDYTGRPLRDDLAAALSCPVRVAHDATCGLLGEHASGGLRGIDRCGYVTLSTGVGAALRLGRAGHFVVLTTEAGHQLVAGNDRRCACGQHGCLETLTGGRALERHTGRPLAELDDERFWHDYAAALAPGLANIALIAGVEALALGGSIILRRPELWHHLRPALTHHLSYQPLRLVLAELGEDAPLAGAAALLATDEGSVLH
jgi:glucokinase